MLRWLYPPTCELCGEACEHTLCEACLAALVRVPRPICLRCGSPTRGLAQEARCCDACRALPVSGFDFARSALMRDETTIELVYALKYRRAGHLARSLAPLLAELWETTPELRAGGDWGIVPVPIGAQRLFARGYNQAEELARALGRLMRLRVWQPLRRLPTVHASQTRLSARARMANARQAYALRCHGASPAANLLLVDDVYTTGATASACAMQLRKLSGVQQVGVLTLLRAERA